MVLALSTAVEAKAEVLAFIVPVARDLAIESVCEARSLCRTIVYK
jgi:hypothetical protein